MSIHCEPWHIVPFFVPWCAKIMFKGKTELYRLFIGPRLNEAKFDTHPESHVTELLNAGVLVPICSKVICSQHVRKLQSISDQLSSHNWLKLCANENMSSAEPVNVSQLTHPPGENDRHLVRRQFQKHFFNENDRIPIRVSLKFVHRSPIDNKPIFVRVMAWRWTGDKPLPEPMLTQFTDAYMRH